MGLNRPMGGSAVLGVDACRVGWVGVLLRDDDARVLVAPHFAALVDAAGSVGDLAVVGVDIPIGLPDDGPRRADVVARLRLPRGRKSSVFPTPARAAVAEVVHADASTANRGALGVGLSIQAFRLVPKILDVDSFVRGGPPVPVLEVHPEVSFAELDARSVVPSKKTQEGTQARRRALGAAGVRPPAYSTGAGYAEDDLLDACAVAWTARRYAAGTAYPLPDPPEVFSDGLPAAIWV
jgi:predicted RNase H-like nuclease